MSFPLKIAPSHGGSEPSSNRWSPGPTQILNPNGILIGSAIFAGLTSLTDRPTEGQTDHATRSLTIGRIYVRSTAMRPKSVQLTELTNDTTNAVARNSDGVRHNRRLIHDHFPDHQLRLMYSILCAANNHRPVLVFLTVAPEVDSRLRRFLDLKKTLTHK